MIFEIVDLICIFIFFTIWWNQFHTFWAEPVKKNTLVELHDYSVKAGNNLVLCAYDMVMFFLKNAY